MFTEVDKFDRSSINKIRKLRHSILISHKRLKYRYIEYAIYFKLAVVVLLTVIMNSEVDKKLGKCVEILSEQYLVSNLMKPPAELYRNSLMSKIDRYYDIDASNYYDNSLVQTLPFDYVYNRTKKSFQFFWQIRSDVKAEWTKSNDSLISLTGNYSLYSFSSYLIMSTIRMKEKFLKTGKLNSPLTYKLWDYVGPRAFSLLQILLTSFELNDESLLQNKEAIRVNSMISLYISLMLCLLIGSIVLIQQR